MQRPAQKGNTAPNGLSAGKARDGLVHHGLEDGCGKIGGGRALVDEGLNVGFGKHAAARGNGVELSVFRCCLVEPRGVRL